MADSENSSESASVGNCVREGGREGGRERHEGEREGERWLHELVPTASSHILHVPCMAVESSGAARLFPWEPAGAGEAT